MHDVFTTAWVTILVVFCGWGLIYLYELIRAPGLLHKSQQDTIAEHVRTIEQLKRPALSREAKRDNIKRLIPAPIPPDTREHIVRDKVIDRLKMLSLEGIRVVKHIHASYLEYEPTLIERFGATALVDAERSMLLEKRATQSGNTELFCFLIREEYKAILDDVLPTMLN